MHLSHDLLANSTSWLHFLLPFSLFWSYFLVQEMIGSRLGSLLWCFLTDNTFQFQLCLMCLGSFEIINENVSVESRAFQVWLDVRFCFFSKKLWNNLNDVESSACIVGHLNLSSVGCYYLNKWITISDL